MFHNNFGNNFVDRFPKFFHQVIGKNSLCTHHKDFHLTCNTLLH